MTTPPPATTPWVPMWNLQGGVNFQYRGAWVAGTYADGDIVVQNGIAYLCVRPTTLPPAVWPMAPGVSQYATTLPASPYDGQEAVLVDNVTNPSYQWRFRYNKQSTSAYKWEFIGGAPLSASVEADETTTSGSYVDLTTVGPVVTLPRAGDYFVGFSAEGYNSAIAANYAGVVSSAGPITPTSAISAAAANQAFLMGRLRMRLNAQGAGTTLTLRYAAGSGTAHFRSRSLEVIPVRVS